MTVDGDDAACAICRTGRITKRLEQIAFRQMTDKGYVHCRVTVLVGTCDNCHARTTAPEAQAVLDEAVKREYDKLP